MDKERRALTMSVVGALFMAALGFGFFLLTDSEAVLLDGFFSLVGFVMGLLTLRVARLVTEPGDEHFQFGYMAFEPMLNTVKGFIILAVCGFACASAVGAVLVGGRHINAGWGVAYAAIATVGCFAIALFQLRTAKVTGSQLVAVDARTWLVDGFMSLVVAAAFGVAYALTGTRFEHLVPYVDPGLVIALTILMLPVPIRIVMGGVGELLMVAPERSVRREVRSRVEGALDAAEMPDRVIRMVRIGREFWVLVHVLVDAERAIGTVAALDEVRARIRAAVSEVEPRMVVDVMFTGNREWT